MSLRSVRSRGRGKTTRPTYTHHKNRFTDVKKLGEYSTAAILLPGICLSTSPLCVGRQLLQGRMKPKKADYSSTVEMAVGH